MKKFFTAAICVVGVGVLLVQLPVVTGADLDTVKERLENTERIELSGKTLFISDLHLVVREPLENQFDLDFSSMSNVVIVGDLFHSAGDFWGFGRTEEESLRAVLQKIVPEQFAGNIYFMSARAHDPQNLQVRKLAFDTFTFYYRGQYATFLVNEVPVVAFHGDQIHGGFVGGGISWAAGIVGQEVPLERLAKFRLGISEDTWVINGHSHVPGIDQSARVANTGSFVGAPLNKLIFRLHVGTGIVFEEGSVELEEYRGLALKNLFPFATAWEW